MKSHAHLIDRIVDIISLGHPFVLITDTQDESISIMASDDNDIVRLIDRAQGIRDEAERGLADGSS